MSFFNRFVSTSNKINEQSFAGLVLLVLVVLATLAMIVNLFYEFRPDYDFNETAYGILVTGTLALFGVNQWGKNKEETEKTARGEKRIQYFGDIPTNTSDEVEP